MRKSAIESLFNEKLLLLSSSVRSIILRACKEEGNEVTCIFSFR